MMTAASPANQATAPQGTPDVPPGYMKNAKGHLVPMHQVKPIDKLRDELVQMLCETALDLHGALREFKRQALAEVDEFVAMSAAEYDVKLGGKKGNVELISYDGELKLVVQVRDLLALDERMQAGRALIDEYLTEVLNGASNDIVKLINAAFATDAAGQVSVSKVMALRRIDIAHPKWLMAMQAIADAMNVNGSCRYVRFYRRTGETYTYTGIVLDLSQIAT